MSAVPGIKPRKIPPPLSTRRPKADPSPPVSPLLKGFRPPREEHRVPLTMAQSGNMFANVTPLGELFDRLASYAFDPLGFVLWAFPWGEAGTPLEKQPGPEPWQREQLTRIGEKLRNGASLTEAIVDIGCVIEEDVSSGHGIGKSAQVSWLILWAISTFEDTRGVVTANTDTQLRTKTWAELGKWYQLFIGRGMFKMTATAIFIANDAVREKSWRIDAVPWSKENTEAFAGMHNQGKRVLMLFDEASTIDDLIWETTEGVLTDADTQILWLRYGNPTRTSGQFFKRCTQPKRNHYTRVDSRNVRFTNKGQIAAWIEDYGEDSDFVRVRVKGQFPRAGYSNFIGPELVTSAQRRRVPLVTYQAYQKVFAVDPARFGDDFSVITLRQGVKVHWQIALSGFDGPDLAGRVAELARKEGRISCIAYDAIGNGADFDSAIRRVPNLNIPLIPVMWGQPAKDDKQYFNQRAECWGRMRDWLENGEIPAEGTPAGEALANELPSVDYGYDGKMRIQLQSKKDIKKNGGKSPDHADSLALSFVPDLIDRKVTTAVARPVKRRTIVWSR